MSTPAQPRSILKQRAAPVDEELIEEVPASGPSVDRGMQEPESETGSEDELDDDEILRGDTSDEEEEEEDEEDEEAIREMGEGRVKPPKSKPTQHDCSIL